MNALRTSFAALSLLIASVAFPAYAHVDGVTPNASVHTTTHALATGVKRLTVISPVTVILRQGSVASVSFTGADEDVARVEAVVEKDRVVIRNKGLLGRGPANAVTAVVTLPTMEELRVGQRGQVRTEGLLTGQSLRVMVDGPSQVELLTALNGALATSVTGSAHVKIGGQCAQYEADILGAGQIDAAQLQTVAATGTITGEGDLRVNASRTLNAVVNGPGRVHYAGAPTVTEHVGGGGAVVSQTALATKQ